MPIQTPSRIEAIVDEPIRSTVGHVASRIAVETGWLSKARPMWPVKVSLM